MAAEVGAAAVHVTADFGPYGRRRDDGAATALAADGRRLVGTGSPYAVAPGTVTKGDGRPYAVFTPFSRAWRASGWDDPLPIPDVRWHGRERVPSEELPAAPATAADLPPAGEDAAHDRWEAFASDGLAHYDRDRDRPDRPATSALSPYLRFGMIHPRQLLDRLGPSRAHRVFATELAWREFYGDVLFHRPESAWRDLDRRMEAMPVDTGAAARRRFDAWREGRTGYPLVDAGMRQLLADRLGPQPGPDGGGELPRQGPPPAVAVGCSPLPAPPGRRRPGLEQPRLAVDRGDGDGRRAVLPRLQPGRQSQRFDPDGAYIRRWVPELAHAEGVDVHAPWQSKRGVPLGYEPPMVDHAAEREEALRRYELTKRARAEARRSRRAPASAARRQRWADGDRWVA